LREGATAGSLRDAVHDLDAFLTLFPEHLPAYMIRDMLQAHVRGDALNLEVGEGTR
jgi:hypothetical protein